MSWLYTVPTAVMLGTSGEPAIEMDTIGPLDTTLAEATLLQEMRGFCNDWQLITTVYEDKSVEEVCLPEPWHPVIPSEPTPITGIIYYGQWGGRSLAQGFGGSGGGFAMFGGGPSVFRGNGDTMGSGTDIWNTLTQVTKVTEVTIFKIDEDCKCKPDKKPEVPPVEPIPLWSTGGFLLTAMGWLALLRRHKRG